MKVFKFDFRRLCDNYDASLVGKRVILDNTIDDIFYAVEDGTDDGEILTKGQMDDTPFWSEENGEWFWYAYVLDEGFIEEEEEPLAQARWFRADVEAALNKRFEDDEITSVSDSAVNAVIDRVSWRAMESAMVERGWDFIDMAVDEYVLHGE